MGAQKYLENPSNTKAKNTSKGVRQYINCSYAEKEEAKRKGAKWDASEKKWYIPEGKSSDGFEKWL